MDGSIGMWTFDLQQKSKRYEVVQEMPLQQVVLGKPADCILKEINSRKKICFHIPFTKDISK